MLVHCPHCQNRIEVAADVPLADITCPTCGSTFNLFNGKSTSPQLPGGKREIGHFQLVRELGIGQFGTVWLANDTQLERTVAIKIPRREQLAPEEVDRFFREARAAAQLRHPHIVNVHEVGRDGDTAYIVSDYIDGASLKDWLSGQRLTARDSAELVFKVAEALDHAHRAGVVHRDVKPANIILDKDGEPHVTDFGLARRVSGEVTMTLDGQIVGTPSYMSPEQAGGKGHEADARSDVYSLGVVLFELLTGELPFRGDREMLLLQIRRDEPPRPRKLNHHIPRDLETICLKCLEKAPFHRYESARKLAADLERFLDDRPIHARPIGRAVRGWRWARRNPSVASLSAAVILLLLAVTVGSTVAAVRIARARDEADRNALEAERSAEQEREARAEAERAKQQAETNLTEAQRQRTQAEESFRQARQAVDEYFTVVSSSPSLSVPAFEPLRKQLLESAMRYHERFVQEHGHDPAVRAELAASHFRVGLINQAIGLDWVPSAKKGLAVLRELVDENVPLDQFGSLRSGVVQPTRNNVVMRNLPEAMSTATEYIRLLEILVARFPDVPGFRNDLAILHGGALGVMQYWSRQLDAALLSFERAEEIFAPLIEKDGASPDHLYAHGNNTLQKARVIQALARPAEAESSYKSAISIFHRIPVSYSRWQDVRYNLACTKRDLASLVWKSPGRREEAETELREAIGMYEQLAIEFPEVPQFLYDSLTNSRTLAWELNQLGRYEEAERAYRVVLEGVEKLSIDLPHDLSYQQALNQTIDDLANLLRAHGRAEDLAELTKQKASIDERRFRRALEQSPRTPRELNDFAWLLANASDPRLRDPVRAVAFAKKAVELEPKNSDYWNTLGVAQYRAGDWHEAVAALTKSIARTSGGNAYDFFFLAMAHAKLGENERSRERFERAVKWMEKNRPKDEELERFHAEAAELLSAADPPAAKPHEQPEAQQEAQRQRP